MHFASQVVLSRGTATQAKLSTAQTRLQHSGHLFILHAVGGRQIFFDQTEHEATCQR